MATNWVYVRIEPKKFGKGHRWKLADAKNYWEHELEYHGVSINTKGGFIYADTPAHHSRPKLTNLLGVKLLTDCLPVDLNDPVPVSAGGGLNAMPYVAGDSLFIHNLSHLSTDPAVIGSLVHTIINRPNLNFTIVSLGISSANISTDPDTKALFDQITNWRTLNPRMPSWKPKYIDGVYMLDNGGGDGGGDGGC
jgi:hypothetical protein